jgi:hypothetical protein
VYAFLSYQTNDKIVAGRIKSFLDEIGVPAFLAHEDIEVSEEWRLELLRQLRKADIFIAILSAHYNSSPWCVQESGMAALRRMTIIPLSIDGSIPRGFISHLQCTRIDPSAPSEAAVLAGIAKRNVSTVIDAAIRLISESRSFRHAEANFELILPYLRRASAEQIATLLKVSAENGEVCNATLCAREHLPPLLKTHGQLMEPQLRTELSRTLDRYAPKRP